MIIAVDCLNCVDSREKNSLKVDSAWNRFLDRGFRVL